MSLCIATLSLASHRRLQPYFPSRPFLPLPLSLCSPTFFLPHSLISLCWARSLPYSFCSGPQAEADLFNKCLAGWAVDVAAVGRRLMWPLSTTGEWIPGRESPDGLGLKQFTPGSPRWAPYGITLHIWILNADWVKLITWLHLGLYLHTAPDTFFFFYRLCSI